MTMDSILPVGADAADGQPGKRKYTKSEHYKQRRRHDRFNGMTEEEVRSRTLPDHLASNLDVVIVSRHFISESRRFRLSQKIALNHSLLLFMHNLLDWN